MQNQLPLGTFGSITSPLIKMLEKGHNRVKLSKRELDIFRCWIDLAAPHYGDYTEGMNSKDLKRYNNTLKFRKKYEKEEAEDIKKTLQQ